MSEYDAEVLAELEGLQEAVDRYHRAMTPPVAANLDRTEQEDAGEQGSDPGRMPDKDGGRKTQQRGFVKATF